MNRENRVTIRDGVMYNRVGEEVVLPVPVGLRDGAKVEVRP